MHIFQLVEEVALGPTVLVDEHEAAVSDDCKPSSKCLRQTRCKGHHASLALLGFETEVLFRTDLVRCGKLAVFRLKCEIILASEHDLTLAASSVQEKQIAEPILIVLAGREEFLRSKAP